MRSMKIEVSREESEANTIQYLEFIRDVHAKNGPPEEWYYKGAADLLLKEGKWYTPPAEVVPWKESMMKACFRNAALYAMTHPGIRYVEGYATAMLACHHAWCVDAEDRVIELTWKEPGSSYFGVEFPPKKVMRGAVLFNFEQPETIYKKPLKRRKDVRHPKT